MSDQNTQRLVSLDVFRGITIAGMILVNNPGTWSHVYSPLRHAEWNGCTPTDLVFPFFLFIVGVAITLSLGRRKSSGDTPAKLYLKIFRRSITLFFLGLFLSGFPWFELGALRVPGVLQRIAVVYLFSSIIYLKSSIKIQVYITVFLLLFYWGLMTLVPVPGIGEANLEPGKNLGAWLDNLLLNGHLWASSKVWDPEGILSTIPAIGSAMIGVLTGEWLRSKNETSEKVVRMFVVANLLLVTGYIWDFWFPINKSIWTSSYTIYTGGLALHFLTLCYWFIDVKQIKWFAKPFQVYGLNAITVFFMSGIMTKLLYLIKIPFGDGQEITIKSLLFDNLFLTWLDPINASLLWAIIYVTIWLGLMWILYKRKIFIKI